MVTTEKEAAKREPPSSGLEKQKPEDTGFDFFKDLKDSEIVEFVANMETPLIRYLEKYITDKVNEIGTLAIRNTSIDLEKFRHLQNFANGLLAVQNMLRAVKIEHRTRSDRLVDGADNEAGQRP